jgi:tetratricopeptide (TPR) repeat protein
MARSVALHPNHKETVRRALECNGFLTQGDLAANLEIALSTVNNFFTCKKVSISKFEQICETLNLDKREITQPIQVNQQLFNPVLFNAETWVGRESIVNTQLANLKGETRLLWITGISGIGKTTLGECLASQAWGSNPSFQWIYVEILDGQSPDFATGAAYLLTQMGEPELDPQECNDPKRLSERLVRKLQTHPYWIQLDSLERLLNSKGSTSTEFADNHWALFFRHCMTAQNFASHLILTAQAFPSSLAEFSDRYPNVWSEIRLGGLAEEEERLDFFKKRDVNMDASTNRDILNRIAQIYEGHPLVLKVIAEEIREEFASDVSRYWQTNQTEFEQVARDLNTTRLDERLYNDALDKKVRERIRKSLKQLPKDALDLICCCSVFRRPVPMLFWLEMIEGSNPQQQKAAYRVLSDRALIEREGHHQNQPLIRLHNLIRDVAYDLLKADNLTWQQAECKAAHLWLTEYRPAIDAPKLEIVRGYLEAIAHYCNMEDWDMIADLVNTEIERGKSLDCQLFVWSYYREFLLLQSQLLSIAQRLEDSQQERCALNQLGNAYHALGNYEQSIDFYQSSLTIVREMGDRQGEGRILGNLGMAYNRLGKYEKAIGLYHQSLNISRKIDDLQGEGITLGNLGSLYFYRGQYEDAISFYQQHYIIECKIGDRQGEGIALANLGEAELKVEQYSESFTHNQLALEIFREIGDRASESATLKNLAELHQALGKIEKAQHYCHQALALATELGIPLAAECEALLQTLEISSEAQQS